MRVYVNSKDEFDRIYHEAPYNVTEILPISEDIIQMQIKRKDGYHRISRKSNVVIGAYVTAWARIEMYKGMKQCIEKGCTIHYTDTGKRKAMAKKDPVNTPVFINRFINNYPS